MDIHDLTGSPYGFSGTRLEDLHAAEITLVGIAADTSGSVHAFAPEITACIQEIVRACRKAPRADTLMLRLTTFADRLHEVHGFQPIPTCDPDDYRGAVGAGGSTALYDAAHNAIGSVAAYATHLAGHALPVNGVVFVITDGFDNASALGAKDVAAAVRDALAAEDVDGIQTVLVGVDVGPGASQQLMTLSAEAGFDRYLELDKADADHLLRLARFASRSVALTSTALGTGGRPVASLTF